MDERDYKAMNEELKSAEEIQEIIDSEKLLIMLARHYQDTKERYFDRHMKTVSASNTNRRELTVFEQSEWQSFPLVQGTKLQILIEKIASGYNFTSILQKQLKEKEDQLTKSNEMNERLAESLRKLSSQEHIEQELYYRMINDAFDILEQYQNSKKSKLKQKPNSYRSTLKKRKKQNEGGILKHLRE